MSTTRSIRMILGAGAALGLVLAAAPANLALAQEQDQPTNVDGVVVSGGGVPIPRVGVGAPAFSPLEIAEKGARGRDERRYYSGQMQILEECYLETYEVQPNEERMIGYRQALEAANKLAGASVSAEELTRRAQQVRLDAGAGRATHEEVVAAELARQEAVLRLMEAEQELNEGRAVAIDVQELARNRDPIGIWRSVVGSNAADRARALENPYELVPPQYRDLKLENISVAPRVAAGGEAALYVTGAIRNTRTRRIQAPPIAVTAVDELGYALLTQTAEGRSRIEPGEAMNFAFELKPSPILSASVVVAFTDPNRPVWLLPASADQVCSGVAIPELDPRRAGRSSRVNTSVRGWISRP